jgi:hypothetical protein
MFYWCLNHHALEQVMDHTLVAAIETLIADTHKDLEIEEAKAVVADSTRWIQLASRATALVDALSLVRALDPTKAAASIINVRHQSDSIYEGL